MLLFYSKANEAFDSVWGKTYTLCESFDGDCLYSKHVTLRKIPTRKEAELIMSLLYFPNTNLCAREMEPVKFADEK